MIASTEPADRPFTVALSAAEMIAVINWHASVARKIPAKVGAAAMGKAYEPFRSSRRTKALFEAAREQLKAHYDRANELSKIVNPK